MKKILNSSIIAAVGLLFVMAFSPLANAAENPFGMSNAVKNMHVATNHEDNKCGGEKKAKCGEGKSSDVRQDGKCGEGKCGEGKSAKKDGKCGEGKCGASMKESKCGDAKKAGKCGGEKKAAKCGASE